MGRRIFVSYKYSDSNVTQLNQSYITTVRDYVDELETIIEDADHVYQGEDDDQDLSALKDTTISSKLGDKIFYSSVTIVLISQGMRNELLPENDQWIPWEISYSLREQSRESGRSKTNAILAVVLPNRDGIYDYYIRDNTCPYCNCRTLVTGFLFNILSDNMFNIKKPEYNECSNHSPDNKPYVGYSSYIYSVKWSDFIENSSKYIDIALEIKGKIGDYNITKRLRR